MFGKGLRPNNIYIIIMQSVRMFEEEHDNFSKGIKRLPFLAI